MLNTLAISDGWTVGMFGINLVFNGVLAIILLWVKQRTEKIDDLQAQIKRQTSEQVKTEFAARDATLKQILARLERGDNKFETHNKNDHELELKTYQAVQQLRLDITERYATKQELEKTRAELLRKVG